MQPQAGSAAPEAYYLFKNNTVDEEARSKKGGKPTTITTHSIKRHRTDQGRSCSSRSTAAYRRLRGAERPGAQTRRQLRRRRPDASARALRPTNGTYYYLFKYFPNDPNGRRS